MEKSNEAPSAQEKEVDLEGLHIPLDIIINLNEGRFSEKGRSSLNDRSQEVYDAVQAEGSISDDMPYEEKRLIYGNKAREMFGYESKERREKRENAEKDENRRKNLEAIISYFESTVGEVDASMKAIEHLEKQTLRHKESVQEFNEAEGELYRELAQLRAKYGGGINRYLDVIVQHITKPRREAIEGELEVNDQDKKIYREAIEENSKMLKMLHEQQQDES